MEQPTTTEITSWSGVSFDALDQPVDDSLLQTFIDRAAVYIEATTGRMLDGMPSNLVTIAQEAIQRRVEQVAYWRQEDYVETGTDDQVQSFSVSGYSETRHESGSRASRGTQSGYPLVNPWPALNSLLWLLMTDAMEDHWREVLSGVIPPAFGVTEVDWGNRDTSGSGFVRGSLPDDPYPTVMD